MKKIIFLILLLSSFLPLSSQKLALEAQLGIQQNVRTQLNTGFNNSISTPISLRLHLPISSKTTWVVGLAYAPFSYSTSIPLLDPFQQAIGNPNIVERFRYIGIPTGVRLRWGNAYLLPGVQVNILSQARGIMAIGPNIRPDWNGRYNIPEAKPLGISWFLELGYQAPLSQKLSLTIAVKFQNLLSNVIEEDVIWPFVYENALGYRPLLESDFIANPRLGFIGIGLHLGLVFNLIAE